MSEARRTKLGDVIFSSIDDNDFLNVLYDNMLYNYAILKLHLEGYQQPRQVDIQAALRFADLLSKSTHPTKSDDHKMWAQAIITLLLELYPGNEDVAYYAGSVLSSIGNFRGSEIVRTVYNSTYEEATLQGKAFATFISDYLSVPSEQEKKFFIPQKQIFDQMGSEALSYSAPTSMGKSYIMEVFIKDKIRRGEKFNFARIVPTKALINEVREDTLRGLDKLLEEMNYSVVTAASDYSLDEDHNYILVMTPERLLYLLINRPEFRIDYIFIDEAHKMTGRNSRGPFYYKIVDMLAQRTPMPHFIFASPNIPNPEVYLKLVTEAQEGADNAISSTFSPVTQFKFLISQETKSIRIFNDHTQDSIFVCKYGNPDMSAVRLMRIMAGFDVDKPLEEKRRNIAYFSGKDPAIHAARQYAEGLPEIDDKELRDLADDIKAQVHGDYYLAKLIRKGVAYHIGYLPSSIRLRIEKLFKGGKITAMFCTSTLIEGVNLPADNLFITNYRSGRPKMTSVEFRNLIGRVGRIKFNLYGNVFFISDGKHVTEKEFVRYLQEPIPDQKLSIVEELKPKLKKHVAETLLSGSARIEPYVTPGGTLQPDEEYVMMRKFGLILLQDIMDDRNSLVRREFAEFLPPDGEAIIRSKFAGQKNFIDHDINISADQSRKLAAAIHAGAHYPKPQNGRFTHAVVLGFLEELSRIFDWDRYESQTLGKRNGAGEHAKLSWYAVILAQWMEGHGLSFLMEVLRLNQDGKLSVDDVLQVFLITENYLFRRNICDVPTNALNKIFLNLNREILRYDNTAEGYVEKFIYALLSKRESGRFPDDEEFTAALATKQVYLMRGKYKAYLFERLENFGTIETKDVYTHLDNNVYTIEHIMPQHLSPAWTESLGANAAEIHSTWVHRLANLTLTGYNPNLSNKPFVEKRDAEEGGYKASGLKMNQRISGKESWGLPELEERNAELMTLAKKIWSYPQTKFVPAEREFDSCTLDDENAELTGRDIVKYSYQNVEQPVTSWADMFEHVIKFLHQKDKSILSGLAYSTSTSTDLVNYVSSTEDGLRSALKIDDNIFVERNTSTAMKISILRRLFVLYDADPMDLVFFLKDTESEKVAEAGRHDVRRRYWTYALPIIQKQHMHRGTFSNCSPTTSNTVSGFFGISGVYVSCVANYDFARIDFNMAKGDAAQNKALFDILYSHKAEIEAELGISLVWERADDYKASWISYHLRDVSITKEADWPRMAKFHAEWSDKICNAVLPYLQDPNEASQRLVDLASIFRSWTIEQSGVNAHPGKCNRTYTRFTTDGMSAILPDIPNAPSGWNTDNHYFYEIVNRTGSSFFIQFSISSRNATPEFLAVCERINDHYPAKLGKEEWQWRTPFKTTTVNIGEQSSKESIYAQLDQSLEEILAFESDLQEKLSGTQEKPAEAEMNLSALEKQFHQEMLSIYTTAKKECGYNASRFLQMIGEMGGLAAAKQLISKVGGTEGFATLWEHHRLDLSVEAHVLKPEYAPLFTDVEKEMCRERLEQFGFAGFSET